MWVSETKFRVSGFRVWGLVNLEVDVDDGHKVLLLHAEHQGVLLLGRGTTMSAGWKKFLIEIKWSVVSTDKRSRSKIADLCVVKIQGE
jgi:hypothetical protein